MFLLMPSITVCCDICDEHYDGQTPVSYIYCYNNCFSYLTSRICIFYRSYVTENILTGNQLGLSELRF